ncbi:MAG: hypothetical protein ABSH36_01565 [Solirubrobacteraceae bacterium]
MSKPKHRFYGARIATVLLAAGACLFAMPCLAAANSYHDLICRIPYGPSAGRAAPADDVTYAINDSFMYAGNNCASGGSLYTAMDGGPTHPYGDTAADTFTAPAGLTISGFKLWRYEADTASQPYGSPASNLSYIPGPASVQGLCTDGCSRGTPNDPLASENAVSESDLSGVTQIQWSAACGGGPGGTCPASGNGTYSSQYDVYAVDVDLVDNTPPVVSAVGGPLVGGGTLSGQQTISFNASDGQSGVYGGTLLVDGRSVVSQILDTNGGACESLGITSDGQRSFEHAQPCKSSVSASLTLNTSEFAAGQHSLELIVEDAAGNRTIAYDGTITTSGPPLVGTNGGAITGRGTANGEPCAGEELDLVVNGKRRPPSIAYGKPVAIKGVLHCGTVPIRGARVAITTIGGPPSAVIDTTVQTAQDGSFSYKVPGGPDRLLRFSYTTYSNDPGPSATATVAVSITPRINLRIFPHRTHNGKMMHLSGTITGGPYPPQGVTLDVEVREGRHWRIFDQTIAGRKGHFRYGYRFHATIEPETYTFRVSLPDTGAHGYPYTPGASNTASIHVNP